MDNRKRLRPWLLKHVEAGDYGLKWLDKDKQIFCIPWIHRSNKSWNKNHCQVFKEWARFTSRYREGDVDDWPSWKTRLRTALTKLRDFDEVSEMHKLDNVENPYKAYKFVTVDNLSEMTDCSTSSKSSPNCSQYTDFSPGSSSSPPYDALLNIPETLESNLPNIGACFIAGNIPKILESVEQIAPQCNNFNTNTSLTKLSYGHEENISMVYDEQSIDKEDNNTERMPSDLCSLEFENLVGKLHSNEINMYKDDSKLEESPQTDQLLCYSMDKPLVHYQIYYLNNVVKKGSMYGDGYHFYFGHLSDEFPTAVFGPKCLHRIQFPDVNSIKMSINSKQQNLIQNILLKLRRGFMLQCHEGDIYVQRLCQTRIYTSSFALTNELLDRSSKKPFKIFDFNSFKEQCKEGNQHMILTFAQEFSLDLLMHIKLTHVAASELLPPLTKNDLFISDLNSEDKILEHEIRSLCLDPQ